MMTAMIKVPSGQPWAEEAGTYWTGPSEGLLAEVHPLLMVLLLMLPADQRWYLLS